MIGIVIITHGNMGIELLKSAEMMIGQIQNAIAIPEGQDALEQDLVEAIGKVDDGSGVILLVDLCGGSCCNTAGLFLTNPNIEVISGVNLPMLIRLINYRDKGLEMNELIAIVINGAKEGIRDIRKVVG